MLESNFKQILHIGPNYKRHKGGMGAVIELYQKNMPGFTFVSSYEGNYNSFINIPYFLISFFKIFWILLFNKNIEIIHAHGASFGSFYRKYLVFVFGKYFFKKKFIYHLHGAEFKDFYFSSNKFLKKIISSLFNNADCVIVLSERWLEFVNENFQPNKVVILNNPIKIPANFKAVKKNDDLFSLLFLGRIGNRKGIFDLLEIFAENIDHYKSIVFLKIGGDGETKKLKLFIEKNNLEGLVEYLGWVDGKTKENYLSQCDLLLLPSYNEGLPIVILEAMSYGKAIIASKVGGIPDVVKDGVNGYLIDPGDKNALKENIDRLIYDKAHLQELGNNSFELVKNFDISHVLFRVQSLYNELAG